MVGGVATDDGCLRIKFWKNPKKGIDCVSMSVECPECGFLRKINLIRGREILQASTVEELENRFEAIYLKCYGVV